MPGITTLAAEVTHISKHGFWLLLANEELLVPFDQFPWFRQGTIEQISDVQWPTPDHLYWPGTDRSRRAIFGTWCAVHGL